MDHEAAWRLEIKKDEAESQEETHNFMEPPNQLRTVSFLLVFAYANNPGITAGAHFPTCQQ